MQLGHREWWSCGAQKRGLPPGGHGWGTALPTLSPREPRTHHQDQLSGEARPCSILPRKGQAVAGDRSLQLAGGWWPSGIPATPSVCLLSSPLPSPASASSHLSYSPLPARPPCPSPSSSPLCFLPPLLPLVALFTRPTCLLSKSILSQRSGWKNAALGTAGRNALVSGLFLPTTVEAAESLGGTILGTQLTHALHPNTDPAPSSVWTPCSYLRSQTQESWAVPECCSPWDQPTETLAVLHCRWPKLTGSPVQNRV